MSEQPSIQSAKIVRDIGFLIALAIALATTAFIYYSPYQSCVRSYEVVHGDEDGDPETLGARAQIYCAGR